MAHRAPALLAAAATAALVVSPIAGAAPVLVAENFDDGVANGFTQQNSIGGSSFAFPASSQGGLGYQLSSAATPLASLGTFGPARTSGYAAGDYTDFLVQADLVGFDGAVNQAVGLAARITQIGAGTTDGYLLNYNPSPDDTTGFLQINRITNEGGAGTITGVAVPKLDPAHDYHLVFEGVGSTLTGTLTSLTDLSFVPVVISAADPNNTYTFGRSGLVVANIDNPTSSPGFANRAQTANGTFDNFTTVPEPASLGLLGLAAAGLIRRRRRA